MSATAIVRVTVRVRLSQPWSNSATVGEIIKQSKHEAVTTVANMIKNKPHIDLAEEPEVKIVYEERK
jgi:hypothetical protein